MADESLKKENEQQQKIDIDQILKDKAGKKAKFIPWFVKRWLKKTLHQDEVNRSTASFSEGQQANMVLISWMSVWTILRWTWK